MQDKVTPSCPVREPHEAHAFGEYRTEWCPGIESGPSRTPRPAHPAELAADRLMDLFNRYTALEWRLTAEEIEAIHTVRKALWRLAREDEK